MRAYGMSLTVVLFLAPLALAQQNPPGGNPIIPIPGNNNPGGAQIRPVGGQPGGGAGAVPPALDPQNNRLDAHLISWEAKMKSVESIIAKLERYEKLKDGTAKVLKGEARYLRPNYFALQMIRQDNPNLFDMYIGNGQIVYEYVAQRKVVRWRKLENSEMQVQNSFLGFLFLGMNAATAKQNYDLKITKEDDNYIYLAIQPRLERDLSQFKRAEMVLLAKTMLPRRLWFEHVNGDEVTWDVTAMDLTTKLSPKDFVPPPLPKEWKSEEVPMPKPAAPMDPGPPPRVVRPSSGK